MVAAARGAVLEKGVVGVDIQLHPANSQQNINPDVLLKLAFLLPPAISSSGEINVYNSEDRSLVCTLDLILLMLLWWLPVDHIYFAVA